MFLSMLTCSVHRFSNPFYKLHVFSHLNDLNEKKNKVKAKITTEENNNKKKYGSEQKLNCNIYLLNCALFLQSFFFFFIFSIAIWNNLLQYLREKKTLVNDVLVLFSSRSHSLPIEIYWRWFHVRKDKVKYLYCRKTNSNNRNNKKNCNHKYSRGTV